MFFITHMFPTVVFTYKLEDLPLKQDNNGKFKV